MDTLMATSVAAQDDEDPVPDSGSATSRSSPFMSEQEQADRRNSIRSIMADGNLTEIEKRRSIQSLMDGRRRSSATGTSSIYNSGDEDSDQVDNSSDVDEGNYQQHPGIRRGTASSGDGSDYATSMAGPARMAAGYYEYSDDDNNMSDMEDDDLHGGGGQDQQQQVVFGGGPLSRQNSATVDGDGDGNSGGSGAGPAQLECTLQYNRRGSLGYNRRASLVTGGGNLEADAGGGGSRRSSRAGSRRSSGERQQDDENKNEYEGPPQKVAREDLSRLDGDNNAPRRVRRYGRAMSLQEYSDGAFAATAAMASPFFEDDPQTVNKRMEKSRPNCDHYERNCTIVSPCCGLAFGCRICHDDCPALPPPLTLRQQEQWLTDGTEVEEEAKTSASAALEAMEEMARKSKKMGERRRSMPIDLEEEETHHEIDRFAIREVICRKCYTRQSSKTNNCITCGLQFGEYHCDICNLWMSIKEAPYHCRDCGFCRVGGRENFQHCHDCGMCIDALLFDDHNCKVGKYMSNCPVCQEDLFSSRYASHEMPCGHAIHWHCFKELTSYDTRCPVCKKTAETSDQMAATWSAMAMGIALQPVPADLARVVTILCYDCEERDENRRWHFLGVRCTNCLSFNTTVERTVMMGREAAAFLDEQDALGENNTSGSEFGAAANLGMHGLAYEYNPPDHQQQLQQLTANVEGMNMDEGPDDNNDQRGGGDTGSGAGASQSGGLNEGSMEEDQQQPS